MNINKALWYARNNEGVNHKEINVNVVVRKSIIQFNNKLWICKNPPSCFHIPIRSNRVSASDVAETYILYEIEDQFYFIPDT